MKSVRLGVIGCGEVGQKLLHGASRDSSIEVVAVADLRESAVRAAAAKYKVGGVHTNPDSLLADPWVEGVVLALPAGGRAEIALRALGKGKHVLLEKPVATHASEVRRIIAAKGDRIVACGSARYRVIEHARLTSQLVASGVLGELRVLQARSLFAGGEPPSSPPPMWRLSKSANGGGTLMNLGCYDIDYLLGLTGWSLKPKQVFAQAWPVPSPFAGHVAAGSDAEAHYVAMIRCENGAIIQLERAEYATIQSEEAWRIVGTRGSLRLQMTPAENQQIIFDEAVADKGVTSSVVWKGEEDFSNGHAGVIRDFAAAIRENRPPVTSIEQSLLVQQICDAIYESAKQGTVVNIE